VLLKPAVIATVDLDQFAQSRKKVIEDALHARRRFNDHRTILLQIQIAHCIDHVRVGRRDQRFRVETFFPDTV